MVVAAVVGGIVAVVTVFVMVVAFCSPAVSDDSHLQQAAAWLWSQESL